MESIPIDVTEIQKSINSGKIRWADEKISQLLDENINREDSFQLKLLQLEIYRIRSIVHNAQKLIEELLSSYSNDKFKFIQILNLKSEFDLITGEKQQSLRNIEKVNSILLEIDDDKIDRKKLEREKVVNKQNKAKYYEFIGDYDLSNNYFIEAIHRANDYDMVNLLLELQSNLASNYSKQGLFDKAIDLLENRLDVSKENNNSYQEARTYLDFGTVYQLSGDYQLSIEFFEKAEKINKKLQIPEIKYLINNLKAKTFQYTGDLELAKSLNKENVDFASQIGSKTIKSDCYNSLGNIYYLEGEIDLSQEYYFLSLSLNEEIGDPTKLCTSYINIGHNFKFKGELDKALDFTKEGLNLADKLGSESKIATCYVNIGYIYHMQGKYDKAEKYYKKCLVIDKKFGNNVMTSETYYNLLVLYLEQDNQGEAEKYLHILENIDSESDNKLIHLRYRLAKAQILKLSSRSINKAKAQQILLDIKEEEPSEFELYVSAMFHLLDLLLIELRQTGEEEVLMEIKEIVESMQIYAENQQMFSLLAEIYLIKSRIALLEMDIDRSQLLLEEAENISREKGLNRLAIKISSYYDQLLDQITIFENLLEKDTSLQERLEQVGLQELFMKMINTKTEDMKTTPEDPTMFLIINDGGLTIFKRNFKENSKSVNEELIAGLLSALHSLSGEVFNTNAGTQRIKHQDYTIILEPDSNLNLLYSYVFKGQSFSALKKIEQLVKTIRESKTIHQALSRDVTHLTKSEKHGMELIVNSIFLQN